MRVTPMVPIRGRSLLYKCTLVRLHKRVRKGDMALQ